MDTYSLLRAFADSWFLLAMFSFFIGVVIWAFLPGLRHARDEAANIPFREDEKAGCRQDCAACSCNADLLKGLNDV